MCDTMVHVSRDGVLFAKNSDRDANEAQVLEWHPAADHGPDDDVAVTYRSVPQVAHTYAVVVSRPWWMFGAEMGANEHGVVIGNEAVFTTEPDGEESLLGMDLLRLALERSRTADAAAQVIVELLERYGQGGACSVERPDFTYHNSFLIADPHGAVVLETAGSQWATERVRAGARSISNGLSIEGFAQRYSRVVKSRVVGCARRRARTEAAIRGADGVAVMMAALRDHGEHGVPTWSPVHGSLEAPCVHAGGVVASSQTTGSLVGDLRGDIRLWATGTAAPCTSLFKPVGVHEPVDLGAGATNQFDPDVYWWSHEPFHRRVMVDYRSAVSTFGPERDDLEATWIAEPPSSADAFAQARAADVAWLATLGPSHTDDRPSYVSWRWRHLDEDAHVVS